MSKCCWSYSECIIYNCRVAAIPFWIPQIGMAFSSFDEAWDFWVTYGGRIGFDVRKCYTNTSTLDGLVTSSRFVCSNQGSLAENKNFSVSKRNRAHTRTGCRVRMGITFERENRTYKVHDLFIEHNHILQTAQTSHLMPSQRNIGFYWVIQVFVYEMKKRTFLCAKGSPLIILSFVDARLLMVDASFCI